MDSTSTPRVQLLSNGSYHLMVTEQGLGFSHGWFAARPSGTEDIYKIYAESFRSEEHLQSLLQEAQTIVDGVIGPA